ncbi:MAG: hypothetical protein NT069_21545, partial [Planctomycetota bacterium]|nr:hypothetical protein [Planctomycetota bacterium]
DRRDKTIATLSTLIERPNSDAGEVEINRAIADSVEEKSLTTHQAKGRRQHQENTERCSP